MKLIVFCGKLNDCVQKITSISGFDYLLPIRNDCVVTKLPRLATQCYPQLIKKPSPGICVLLINNSKSNRKYIIVPISSSTSKNLLTSSELYEASIQTYNKLMKAQMTSQQPVVETTHQLQKYHYQGITYEWSVATEKPFFASIQAEEQSMKPRVFAWMLSQIFCCDNTP